MIQLFAYDESGTRYELDLYAEDPIKINISAEDIIDIPRVDSAFSRQFRIPATNTNNRFFKWWYTAGAIDFDITKRVPAEIHIDGLLYKKGQLRLQLVANNGIQDRVEFEVAFLGETKEFGTQIGDGFMNQLPCSELDHFLDHDFVHNSEKAFGDPLLPFAGKIRYGMGIRGYDYDKDGNILQNGQLTIDNTKQKSFTNQSHHMTPGQHIPMIQVKYLVDKIFAQTDFTYSTDSVFNEDWFKYLYIDGVSKATAEVESTDSDVSLGLQTVYNMPTYGEELIYWDNIISDPSNAYNQTTGKYTLANASTVAPWEIFDVNVVVFDQYDFVSGGGAAWELKLYKNGTVVQSVSASPPPGAPGAPYTLILSINWTNGAPLADGDQFWTTLEYVGGSPENPGVDSTSTFQVTNTPDAVRMETLLRDDVKTVDFFKSILTKFRLVMVPSKEIDNQFIIKPWIEYVASGDTFDWTEKLDLSKDIVLSPVFFQQSATVVFQDQPAEDVMNTGHQDQYDAIYGRRIYDSQNELLVDNRTITTVFAPTPVTQIPGYDPLDNTTKHAATFVVPYFAKQVENLDVDGLPQLLPMRAKPRLLFWNGMQDTSDNGSLYFYDLTSPGVKHYDYSMFSYLQDSPSGTDTLDLNWQKDIQYFETYPTAPSGQLGSDVYETYWSQYIASLYSPEARLMTAYFVIDNEDMRNLTFDDVIFVKDSWWRLNKIVDAPLGNIGSVKVELIKLLDYVVPEGSGVVEPGDYTGDLPFDDPGNDVVWGGGLGGWGGTPVNEYYFLINCEDPAESAVGTYPGIIPLGSAVYISGSVNVSKCWYVEGTLVGPIAGVPILQIYPDCPTCLADI